MLVFQVFEDNFLHWFSITGYRQLVDIYSEYNHTPGWFLNFIVFIGAKADIMMPVELLIESVCALALVNLVLRALFMIIVAVLFLLLTYIEFGVLATWPPNLGAMPTWTWT